MSEINREDTIKLLRAALSGSESSSVLEILSKAATCNGSTEATLLVLETLSCQPTIEMQEALWEVIEDCLVFKHYDCMLPAIKAAKFLVEPWRKNIKELLAAYITDVYDNYDDLDEKTKAAAKAFLEE